MGNGMLILPAVALFAIMSTDDAVLLSRFYAKGPRARSDTTRIMAEQFFSHVLALTAAAAIALVAHSVLPRQAIAYFGLVPLTIGLLSIWRVRHGSVSGITAERAGGSLRRAAALLADDARTLGALLAFLCAVRVSVFVVYCSYLLALIAVSVVVSRYVATQGSIVVRLERWEPVLVPLAFMSMGVVLLAHGGAFEAVTGAP